MYKLKNKLDKIESLRGFAAVYVVLHHTIEDFKILNFDFTFLFRFGQEAVILFFILSGFVIEFSFERTRDKSFKTYFFKRFLRIYVPLIIVFFVNALILSINQDVNINVRELIGNFLMLQDKESIKPNVLVNPFLNNTPLWSLSYEWWFYMLYFPIVYFYKKNSTKIIFVLGFFSSLSYIIFPNFVNREIMYMVIWWSGVQIARIYSNNGQLNFKNFKNIFLALGLIILILSINVYISYDGGSIGISPILELRHFVFTFFVIIIALVWKKYNWRFFDSIFGVFKFVAPISYGIYISHYFLISRANYLDTIINNDFLRYMIYGFFCIFFSYVVERIIYIKINRKIMNSI